MASRIVKRHIIKDHDKGTVSEEIVIESGTNVAADETTPQAEAHMQIFTSKSKTSSTSIKGMFDELEKMLGSGDDFPFLPKRKWQ